MGSESVEEGPNLGAVPEPLLLHLLGGVGVDGLAGEAVDGEARGEDLAHGGGGLGVARAPAALEALLQGLLHRRRRDHHSAAPAIDDVRGDVLERDEEAEHVALRSGDREPVHGCMYVHM